MNETYTNQHNSKNMAVAKENSATAIFDVINICPNNYAPCRAAYP